MWWWRLCDVFWLGKTLLKLTFENLRESIVCSGILPRLSCRWGGQESCAPRQYVVGLLEREEVRLEFPSSITFRP